MEKTQKDRKQEDAISMLREASDRIELKLGSQTFPKLDLGDAQESMVFNAARIIAQQKQEGAKVSYQQVAALVHYIADMMGD